MSADQPKPRFEPPPWEQEAFDRFRQEQDEHRAKQELNAALRTALDQSPVSPAAPDAPPPDAAAGPEGPGVQAPVEVPAAQPGATLPETKVAAMLVELRREEAPVKRVNTAVVNTVMAFMVAMGVYIIVRALLLAGDIQPDAGANTLMAGTVSLVVFVTGCAFIGGAYFLFRKYHR